MNYGPTWITNPGFLVTATENVAMSYTVVASGTGIVYSILNGALPDGIIMSDNGVIYGIPAPVQNKTSNQFVVRARNNLGVSDRTFSIDVSGITQPVWNTGGVTVSNSSTYLNVGPSNEPYAINNQYVNFQLVAGADPALTPKDAKFTYYIGDNSGTLPPGLSLSNTGVISGILKDTLEITDDNSAGAPKLYPFTVTVTDSVTSSQKQFNILVVNPDIVRNPSKFLPSLDPGILTTNTNYVPPLQFINGSDLGTVTASNNVYLDASAYDPYPNIRYSVYSVITGTSILTQLPPDLKLNTANGSIYGHLPYQPAYTTNYNLTIAATRFISTQSMVTATNTFTLAVAGQSESAIEWVSTGSLGTIDLGETSELQVRAQQINNGYAINYQLISGTLPDGLSLQRDGSITGKVSYDENTGTYNITVQASDVYEFSEIEKTFSIEVSRYNDKQYTQIFCRPFLSQPKRKIYQDFMLDSFVFDPTLIYRHFDPNFGIQSSIKMILEFGLEKINLEDIAVGLQENFHRRRFQFGDVKVAIAKDSTGATIYEIVYVDVIDDQVNDAGISVSKTVYMNDRIYYPGSVDNMRTQLSTLTLPDFAPVDTNEYLMPKYMRTPQHGDYRNIGYVRVVPLCYALPGQGAKIVSRIKLNGFDFKQFDFEIDRIIVQDSLDNDTAKYLLLDRQSVGDIIPYDSQLTWPTGFTLPLPNGELVTRE